MNVHVHSVDLHGSTAASRFPFALNDEVLAKDSSSLQRAPLAGLSNKPAPLAADDAADPFLPEKIKEIKTTAFAEDEDCWSLVATKELDDPKKSADDTFVTSKQLEELERMLHPQLLAPPAGSTGSEASANNNVGAGANHHSSSAAEVLPDDLSEFFDLQQQQGQRPHSRRSSLAPLLTAIEQQHSGANLHQASSARRSSLAPLLAALEGGGDAFGSSQFASNAAFSQHQDPTATANGISGELVAAAAAERRSSLAMAMASLDRRSSLAGGAAGSAPAQRNSSMDLLLGGLFSSSSSASRRSSLALAQSHLLQDASNNAHHPPSYIQPLNDLGDVAVPSIGGMGRKRKLDEVGNTIENRTDSEEALLAAARQQRRRSSMSLKASILRRMSGFSIGAGSVGHLSRSGSIGHLDQFDWNASSVPEDDDAANSVIPINAFPRRLSSMGMGSTEMLRRLSFGPLAASLFDPAEATPALPPGPGDAAAGLGEGGKDKADEVEPLQTHPLLHPLEVPLRERFGSNNPMAGQMAKKTTKKEAAPQASAQFDPSSRDRQRKNCHPPKPRRVSTASDSSSESSSSTRSGSVTAHAGAAVAAAPKGPSLWQQQQELQQRQRQLRAASAKTASSRRAGGGYNSSSSATSSSAAKVDIDPTRAATKLVVAMERSKKSQSLLHGWDRKMGLKKSHSKTMRMSRTSREKLLEEVGLQLLMAGGGIAAEMAAAQAAAR